MSQEAWKILYDVIESYSYDEYMESRRLAIAESFISNNTTFETEVLLSDESCKSIIEWTSKHINDKILDTVDGLPEWQVTVVQKIMEKLCTVTEIRNIVQIAYDKYPSISNADFYIRKYGDGARENLPWHADQTVVSFTIHLSNYFEYEGGDFVFIEGKEIKRSSELKKGCGVFHSGDVIHSIEPVTKGNRWSLVSFFFAEDGQGNEWCTDENKVIF